MTTFAKDDILLKVSRAKKVEIDFFFEGVRFEQASNHTIEDLRHRATADRLKLAKDFLAVGEALMKARPTQYRHAIGRFYYSMYHSMRAVVYFIYGGDDHEKHFMLPSKTPHDFLDHNIWQNNLKDARIRRHEADYDPYPRSNVSWRRTATELSVQAPELIRLSRDYLKAKGCQYL